MSRRAIVFLGGQQIARMLALPEGVRFLAARDDFLRDGVAVLVEGDALEDQPSNAVLPDLPVALLDRTELAMQATMWGAYGGNVSGVWCPLRSQDGCTWSREWGDGVGPSLAQLADAVQQHLTRDHKIGL